MRDTRRKTVVLVAVVAVDGGARAEVKRLLGLPLKFPGSSCVFYLQYMVESFLLCFAVFQVLLSNREDFENRMKGGDVYRIGVGYVFYLRNTTKGQRLHIISTYFKSHFMIVSFFIGGGTNPVFVLSGFDAVTLAIAFNNL